MVDAETGEKRWTAEVDVGSYVTPTLDADGETLFVGGEGHVSALDAYGDGYWRIDLPAKCQTPPTLAGRQVFVGTFDGFLHAIDTARASVAWSTEIGGFAKGGVAVADGTVYADGGRRLHAVDADSGETR